MKAFKLMKVTGGLAAAGLLLGYGTASFAGPTCPESGDPLADYRCVIIDIGVNKDGDADSKTGAFYELGLTGTLATSIYQAGLGFGSTIIDTNVTSILNDYGVTNGTFPSVDNTEQVGLSDTPTLAQRNVDALNSVPAAQSEAFNVDLGFPAGQGWQLYFDYYLEGTLTNIPSFNDGYFIFYFDDIATAGLDNIPVLRVNITGSSLNLANLDLFGTVSFDFDDNGTNDCTTAFCQNFWNFQTGNLKWYDLEGQGLDITYRFDTNVNPPFPSLDQLTETTGKAGTPQEGNKYWVRQSTLDSSARFDIPEPGSLALLGIGLAGIGLRLGSRRKRVV